MRLLTWLDKGAWSGLHISHLGEPLCKAPTPERFQARREWPAEIRDWSRLCVDCKVLAVKGATGPGAYCECNHGQTSHEALEGSCGECDCAFYRFDPIYEPEQEPA